jgi:drug/metabolite transporter (DMT)-like permease
LKRYVPLIITILIWSWTGIFVKLLQGGGLDPFSQNFYRYGTAVIALLIFTRLRNPAGFKKANARPWVFLLPGAALATFQTFFVLGMYRVTPGFAAIIGTSDVLLVMLIAMFFADERRVVLDPRFIGAIGVGLVAAVCFFIFDRRFSFGSDAGSQRFIVGTCFVLFGAWMWVAHAYLVKWLVKDVGAMVSFSFSATFAWLLMMVVAVVAHITGFQGADLSHITRAEWPYIALVLGSGLLNVGIAQVLHQESIRRLGVSLTRGFTFVIPVLAAVLSCLMLGERLTPAQWCYGLVLVGSVAFLGALGRKLAGRKSDVEPYAAD